MGVKTTFCSFPIIRYQVIKMTLCNVNYMFNARFPEYFPAYFLSSGKYSCTILPSLLYSPLCDHIVEFF